MNAHGTTTGAAAFATIALLVAACGNPSGASCTDQYGRGSTQIDYVGVQCSTTGNVLQCQATASINPNELYVYCPPPSQDVTTAATWSADDATVLRVTAQGTFAAVGVGDTVVRAIWNNIRSYGRPVSVFPGTAPLLTVEIIGSVSLAGQTPAMGGINGALIEVLDGLVAGRSTTSGTVPPVLPGFVVWYGSPGGYAFFGVPSGVYTLRVSKPGYVTQERQVAVGGATGGSNNYDFQLTPSS